VSEDRPQDVGRSHHGRRRSEPAPATAEVLEAYRVAMRDELGELLEELRPDRVQMVMLGQDVRLKPALAERVKLWDLAIKLGRELGAGEELPAAGTIAPPPVDARSPAPRLTARARRELGG
jgi:hypothetical protein